MIGKARTSVLWAWIDRIAARLLIPLILLEFLSGFAILHPRIFGGILLKSTAARMHSAIQPVVAFAFATHGLTSLRRVLARHGIKGFGVDIALAIAGVGLVTFTFYLWTLG